MFYFSSSRICAVSNSIFLLTQIRLISGLKNTLNENIAICSSWINGIGAQNINEKTIISDIFFAPLMSSINISLNKSNIHLDCFTPEISKVLNFDQYKSKDDYRDAIKEAAGRISGLCSGMLEHRSFKVRLSLSGGLDSRCCLAGALKSENMDNLYIYSNKGLIADYKIALSICNKYKLQLNRPYHNTPKTGSSLNRWFICNAGKYHVLYDNGVVNQTDVLSVTGLGSECVKGQFGWRSLFELAPVMRDNSKIFMKLPKKYLMEKSFFIRFLYKYWLMPTFYSRERGKLIFNEIKEWLYKMNISLKSRDVSEYLFTYFRNPAHTGSACYNFCRIYPLLDSDLVALAYSPGRYWYYPEQSPSIITDLLICLNPQLANTSFADGAPVLSINHICERSKFLGSVNNISPYEIIGDPQTVPAGISGIFIQLAENSGFTGGFDYADWKQLALEGYEILPQSVRKHFDFHIWRLQNEFPERQRDNPWLWQIPAKLMSFLLARQ